MRKLTDWTINRRTDRPTDGQTVRPTDPRTTLNIQDLVDPKNDKPIIVQNYTEPHEIWSDSSQAGELGQSDSGSHHRWVTHSTRQKCGWSSSRLLPSSIIRMFLLNSFQKIKRQISALRMGKALGRYNIVDNHN